MKYSTILQKAKDIKEGVEKEYKLIASTPSYYIAKAVLNHKKDVPDITVGMASENKGDYISNQIYQTHYIDMMNRFVKYVETNKKLPSYITWKDKKVKVSDYTYAFARILIYYDKYNSLPKYVNVNSKTYTKPSENTNDVYNYFVKTFGKITCIDDALEKIAGKGYGYYYDDVYSNRQSIDRMKQGKGVNCTDSCHVFYNIGQVFVQKGKYKKVECLHVKCRGGDGHVRLRFTKTDGSVFYRDPACTLESGGTCNWCMDGTLLGVNPAWFLQNVNR